ncbi:probable tubulin polyglutamylase TTLL2 [Dunckerocampus dactyliophorus]|uniref:probable tubulin polyglutamylase TTLL2 n=1 Tax=Dunckerocampus dactyliophorus TaxID=161453 RepID=UPI002404A90D|nr:probable tubulin polyglutamylase TTLL2 [Dunckerocampus dactyliophorus]XP_054617872.1 probable tubulin polyglutamylase TTLL2 [Dunckerocampus dactyliophorus]
MAAALVFRLHDGGPELLRQVLLERGWEEHHAGRRGQEDWNLYWRGADFPISEYRNLMPWQRLNHHPQSVGVTRKDRLERNLRRMRATFGSSLYDFSPAAFILPNDFTRFLAEYYKPRLQGTPPLFWICKPVGLSRGRGIFIFEKVRDLLYDCAVIVQKYISEPLLISGYKFDLRIYVCVKSFHPLIVYIHQEGLVRFATEKYSQSSLQNPYIHLTNASINKLGPFYHATKDGVGRGCKWTLSKFRHFLHSQNINELLLWQRISNIVTLTLLTIAPSGPACHNCVELLGFDILLDVTFKPWLLEVNHNPALNPDCPADLAVKKKLIGDLIDLMSYTCTDHLRGGALLPKVSSHTLPRIQTRPEKSIQNKSSCHRHHRCLPPVHLDRTSRLISATSETLHPIMGPHSRTIRSVSEVTHSQSEDELSDVPSTLPDTSWRGQGLRCPDVTWRLPDITHSVTVPSTGQAANISANANSLHLLSANARQEDSFVSRFKVVQTPLQGHAPPPPLRVGDFIRTFPFNMATLKASRRQLDLKAVMREIRKLTRQLDASQSTTMGPDISDKQEDLDSLLWGPKDPPLLRHCFKA